MVKKISGLIGTFALCIPAFAFAAYQEVPDTLQGPEDIESLIVTIGNWFFTILLALAVIFIVMAAYKYLSSGGGEEVGKAHKMLVYAAIAIAVALLSRGVTVVVQKLVAPNASLQSSRTSSPPAATAPAADDDFFEAETSPNRILIKRCSNGVASPFMVNGKMYGNSAGRRMETINASNPEISALPCSDGLLPVVVVNSQFYSGIITRDTLLNDDPEISVGNCPDGKAPGVKYAGVLYPGDSPSGRFNNIKPGSTPSILIEACADGSMSHVRIDGNLHQP